MAENKKHESKDTPTAKPSPEPLGVSALFSTGTTTSPVSEITTTPPTEVTISSLPAGETTSSLPASEAMPSPPESSAIGLASLASEAAAMEPSPEALLTGPDSNTTQPPAQPDGSATQPPARPDESAPQPPAQPDETIDQPPVPPVPADIAVPPGGEAPTTGPAVPGGDIDLSSTTANGTPNAGTTSNETTVSPTTGTESGTITGATTPLPLSIMPEADISAPGPNEELTIQLPKPTPLTDTQRQRLLNHLDAETVKRLSERIHTLSQSVSTVLSSRPKLARQAFDALRQAQEALFATPERIADSEYITNQVEMIVNNVQQGQKWGRYWGGRIFAYEMVWFVGLVALFLTTVIGVQSINDWLRVYWGSGEKVGSLFLVPLLNTAIWGGIGGVVGALYSLWWHVSDQQDFTPQYNLWYWIQPVMGFILGAVIFLVIGSGFLAVQGSFASTNDVLQYFPALIAVLGGFRQKFVYELFDRIMQAVTPQIKEKV